MPPSSQPSPSTNAPDRDAAFGFALGDWRYITVVLPRADVEPDWSQAFAPAGTWTFRSILDGWAVQDEYCQPLPSGEALSATTIRAFDSRSGTWRVKGVVGGIPGWDEYEAKLSGDSVVMTGCGSREALDHGPSARQRITFFELKPDSWLRRGELSLDGGVTWQQETVLSRAERVGPA